MAQSENNEALGAPVPVSYRGAFLVASGVLLSRISGLIRLRVMAHFLGDSDAADALNAAIKIPNFPQNLFGEGVLSASFIPVYASLVARGEKEEASRVASVIFSLLTVIISAIVIVGVLTTPYFIGLIAPGFVGEKRELTIRLVQIIFPGTGLLVLSAWSLGILNSHHKFFLSYVSPVFWNAAIIGGFVAFRRGASEGQLAVAAAWGLVVGSVLQLGIQLPTTLSLVPRLRLEFSTRLESVRQIISNFSVVVIGRGVVQISAYVDNVLASYLPSGAVSSLGFAQSIYMLPISLFGMSIAASELPAMSQAYGRSDLAEFLRRRITSAIRQVALFVVPSMAGLLILGDVVVGLLFQTGKFDSETSNYVWGVVAGSAIGLLASTLGRLYSSAFYSLRDTRTPLRFSIVRVSLTILSGYIMGLKVPEWVGIGRQWGTCGLTASAGLSGWVEFLLLRRSLHRIVGKIEMPIIYLAKLWLAALLSGGAGYFIKLGFSPAHPFLRGVAVVGAFVTLYFPLCYALRVQEAKTWVERLTRRFR